MKRAGPPRLMTRLLEAALPHTASTAAILGDLHEEYLSRASRAPRLADLWYARTVVAVVLRYTLAFNLEDFVDRLAHNLRYATRRLLRSPSFTLIAVVSLALGIGANTAIFSLVNAVILRDLPYTEPEQLVDIYEASDGYSHGTLSYPDFLDYREASTDVFSDVGGVQLALIQADVEDGVEMSMGEAVTGNYLGLLGVRAAAGRLLLPEDDIGRGAHPVVVLGYGYWTRRFGRDPGVVGATVRLAGRPYTVIGVTEKAFEGSIRGIVPDLFVPITMYDELQGVDANTLEARGNQSFFAKGRLIPGATIAQAEAVGERLGSALRLDYPRYWGPDKAFVFVPTSDVVMNPMIDRVILPAASMIMAVVGLVLLIACANLASFLLARAADRRKEIAVRLAMGARRRTLVGQLMTETLLLSAVGGALGIVLASQALRWLVTADLPIPIPITLDLSLDRTVLGFSVLVSLVAGVAFGLVPALQSTNPDLAPTLRDETAGGGRAKGAALRNLLVAGQVAVSVVLLVGAGLFLRSLDASRRIDPGFGHDPTGILQLATPADRYSEEETRGYLAELEARLRAMPGVVAVGLTGNLQLNTLSTQSVRVQVDGIDPPEGTDFHSVDYASVDEGFLDAAGIGVLDGRAFDASDVPDGERVAVVSETFARRFFPGGSAVGRTFRVNARDTRVVGVAADTKVRRIGELPRPYLYLSHRQSPTSYVTILARTHGDASRLALDMFAEARSLDPDILIVEAMTMERHLAAMLLPRRLGAVTVASFAALALLLAAIGLYGVVSYAVSRRAREVGIRLSLGAEASSIVWMLTGGGMKLVGIGALAGLGASALLARLVSGLLYGVPPLDPVTFFGVPIILAAVALAAAWIPARRATMVDPVAALRSD
jgi:putative ABC transport system permease protein